MLSFPKNKRTIVNSKVLFLGFLFLASASARAQSVSDNIFQLLHKTDLSSIEKWDILEPILIKKAKEWKTDPLNYADKGGNLIYIPNVGSIPSPNITMHKTDGIGKYSEAEFANLVRNGIRPDQNKMTPLMPKFSTLGDDEIHAIWEYLKTVPILEKN